MSHRTLTRKLAKIKPGTLFVGVDLALERNVAVIIDERAKRLARFRFASSRDGYDHFYRQIEAVLTRRQAPAVLIGMEPTNYFWKLLAADLERHRADYQYHLVNPYTVKQRREGDQLDRSKDDNRDAFTIADLLRTGKYTDTQLLHGGYAELRQYGLLYHRLNHDLQRQQSLIQSAVGHLFPELPTAFKDLTTASIVAMLRGHAAAHRVRQLSLEQFMASVRTDFEGKRLQVTRLGRVHALAATSIGLSEGLEALQLAVALHLDLVALLKQQQQVVTTNLVDCFLALPQAAYMLSVPGLGSLTAAIILSEIGDPNHFTNGRQLVKLAGIQPVPNTSGRKSRSRTPMSRQGRPRLRTALFFAVMRLVRLDDHFAQQHLYLQTRPHNPLTKNQALGVLMNKLLRLLWVLIRQQTFYQPDYQPT